MSPVRNQPPGRKASTSRARVGVADEEFGAAAHDLAVVPDGDLAVVVVEEPDRVAGGERPVGPGSFAERMRRRARGDHRMFARSVGAVGRDAEIVGPLHERLGNAGRADHVVAECGEARALSFGLVHQRREEERRAGGGGDAVLGDEAGGERRVPHVHHHRRGAEDEHPQHPEHPGDVARRERGEVDPTSLAECPGRRADLGDERVRGVLYALRLSGGSRRVDQQAAVVGVRDRQFGDGGVRGQPGPRNRSGVSGRCAGVGLGGDQHHVFECRHVDEGVEAFAVVDVAPPIGEHEHACARLAEDEAHLVRAVDVDDRHDGGAEHQRGLVRERALEPVRHPDRHDVTGSDAQVGEPTGQAEAPSIHLGEADGRRVRATDEVHRRVRKRLGTRPQMVGDGLGPVEALPVPTLVQLRPVGGQVHAVFVAATYSSRILRL